MAKKTDSGLKVYILADLEGVSGVFEFDDYYNHKHLAAEKPRTRSAELMVGEVNAAVEGALQAGAGTVVVRDAHGYSNTLPIEKLHPKALVSQGNPIRQPLPHLTNNFDAVVMVGQHAKAGNTRACLNHTYSRRVKRIEANGIEIGEILLYATFAGELGVPTVCVSGDSEAGREAREVSVGISTVQTKLSHSVTSALSRVPAAVCEEIRESVMQALQSHRTVRPFHFEPPVKMKVTYRSAAVNLIRYALRKQWRWARLTSAYTCLYNGHHLSECWMNFVFGRHVEFETPDPQIKFSSSFCSQTESSTSSTNVISIN